MIAAHLDTVADAAGAPQARRPVLAGSHRRFAADSELAAGTEVASRRPRDLIRSAR